MRFLKIASGWRDTSLFALENQLRHRVTRQLRGCINEKGALRLLFRSEGLDFHELDDRGGLLAALVLEVTAQGLRHDFGGAGAVVDVAVLEDGF